MFILLVKKFKSTRSSKNVLDQRIYIYVGSYNIGVLFPFKKVMLALDPMFMKNASFEFYIKAKYSGDLNSVYS